MAILVNQAKVSGSIFNPNTYFNNLSMYFDACNYRSYPVSGDFWFDLSGNNRNASLINSISFGDFGTSSFFALDSINDYILTNYPVTATPALGNWTYEIWTEIINYPTALSSPNIYGNSYRAGTLFGAMNNAGAAIYWYGNNTGTACIIYGIVRGNDAYRSTGGFSMQLNRTYQFTLVNNYSAGVISLFVNGYRFSSTISPTQQYNASNVAGLNIGIGRPQIDIGGQANYSYFLGRIKNAKIYGAALNANQVLQNYNAIRQRYGA